MTNMTAAERNYKNGAFDPYPIMNKYGDLVESIEENIDENLISFKESFLTLAENLPEYAKGLKYDAESFAKRISAIISTLYQLMDDCDDFGGRLYYTAWNAGKEDYLKEKSNNEG